MQIDDQIAAFVESGAQSSSPAFETRLNTCTRTQDALEAALRKDMLVLHYACEELRQEIPQTTVPIVFAGQRRFPVRPSAPPENT